MTGILNEGTKLYQQDLVKRHGFPHSCGMILRCWHDENDDIPEHLESADSYPLLRPLKRGEVGVSFTRDTNDARDIEIVPESSLELIDRTFQPGDCCKKRINDVRAGVITNVRVKGLFEHVITGERIPGWHTADELEPRRVPEGGDYIAYDDWIGQVIEVFDECLVQTSGGQIICLPELSSRLQVGEKGDDIIQPSSLGSSLFNRISGHQTDTVVAVKHTVLAITWLGINQTLETSAQQHSERPRRFWYGPDLSKLVLLHTRIENHLRPFERVEFKNKTNFPFTVHGKENMGPGIFSVHTVAAVQTETTVDVLWHDGSRETLRATEIIPYSNLDEYDCWPGEHVVWKSDDTERCAVVQSVDASQRMASVLFTDHHNVELVPLLELDVHGTADHDALLTAMDGLGVDRGDLVFIHREGTTNGFAPPRVPKIGETEAWVREQTYDNSHLFLGWRKEMSDLGIKIASERGSSVSYDYEGQPRLGHEVNDGSLLWIGEVTDLRLDGSVEVTHPDGVARCYPLQRLTRLYDSISQLEDGIWEDEDLMDIDEDPMDMDGGPMDVDDELYEEETRGASFISWTGHLSGFILSRGLPGQGAIGDDEGEPDEELLEDDPEPTEEHTDAPDSQLPRDVGHLEWTKFAIVPSAPVDHAYYSTPPGQHPQTFMARMAKEYRILQSSLPDSIIVRTYEDRADLLRCLILGPQNTPYEDAPFVIDWMLDSNFPRSPPLAHFLSWTNGNGRVNPNLYEEGKVCLSILGTWQGDKSETWDSARSSLLQAFVSIQGLVLVKEPWFCEPAYEKLRGTAEGVVNSRLYNEKAYVLSRGFVRRALEIPLRGLEEEIRWLYYTEGRLGRVLTESRRLVEKSKALNAENIPYKESEQESSVPRLTGGGIIALERSLVKLQSLWDTYQSNVNSG